MTENRFDGKQDRDGRFIRLPLKWLLVSLSLVSTGLIVALIVTLQAPSKDALAATAMALAVISFGAQLVLATSDYLSGQRQEARASSIHRDTLEAIHTLRTAIDSNLSVTNTLSDRFNTEFQTVLDHVLAGSTRAARNSHEVRLIEEIGTDLRAKALEVAVSAPNSPRSRLASTVVKILHESPATVPDSVSYSRSVISWLQGDPPKRCSAIVSDALIADEQIEELALRLREIREKATSSGVDGLSYIVLPVKPPEWISTHPELARAKVTWIERFASDILARSAVG